MIMWKPSDSQCIKIGMKKNYYKTRYKEIYYFFSGICSADVDVQLDLEPMIAPMAISYLQLFTDASNEMREFFGLRDFYRCIF